MPETRNCVECPGTAVLQDGRETTFECPDCGTTFMDNPRWNERFSL
ncbi:Zn finger [Halorubrum phage HRTV-14]|uniref:Zn finger n=1 Tax=Halorubrum phage HRTV-14 TaxID=2877994 RepID=A0AAE9BV08_9CAUD|nr:Zn finger [Halorubrum phage HRTV-14]UBF20171.1 Zn finger [Halorubrum virus HRTV-26]UFK26272.1 putative CxxC motif protein [Hardygib1 virus]